MRNLAVIICCFLLYLLIFFFNIFFSRLRLTYFFLKFFFFLLCFCDEKWGGTLGRRCTLGAIWVALGYFFINEKGHNLDIYCQYFLWYFMSDCVQVCALSSVTCVPQKSVILTNIFLLFTYREKLADLVRHRNRGLFSSHVDFSFWTFLIWKL